MNQNHIAYVWIVFGVVLMLLEIPLPGLVVIFLGAAATIVGVLVRLGFIETIVSMFLSWFILSLTLIFSLRQAFARLAQGEADVENMDEDLDAYGQIVPVSTAITKGQKGGRITFRQSSWPALCYDANLKVGDQVRLVCREGMTWVVEPLKPSLDLDSPLTTEILPDVDR